MRVMILIPTYNERENVCALIKRIHFVTASIPDVSFSVCVIDDNSPDGTLQAVEKLAEAGIYDNLDIYTIFRELKEGLGRAYINGFERTLHSNINYEYIIQMDADLSHDPKYILDFVNSARNGAELVVGSRYVAGGAIPDWIWYRRLLSRFGNLYARIILSSMVSDYTGGYNMYSTAVLKKIDFSSLNEMGYGFLIALKYRILKHTNNVAQVPIIFYDRTIGESKMPINTLIKNFKLVIILRIWG